MSARPICLVSLALVLTVSASGQVDPQTASKGVLEVWSENLYVRSLSECVVARASKGLIQDSAIVLQNGVLGDSLPVRVLPSRIGSVTIEYLTGKAVMSRYRRVRQRFDVLEIRPISISRGDLLVDCSVYSVTNTKAFTVAGGYLIHWQYDCSTKEFVKAQVEPRFWRID
jgi:hypothetical protein